MNTEPCHRGAPVHLIGRWSIPAGLVLTLAVLAMLVRSCT